MIIQSLIRFKHAFPSLWRRIEGINGLLFKLKYHNIRDVAESVLKQANHPLFRFGIVEAGDLPKIAEMHASMTAEYLMHFDPHPFDLNSLNRIYNNRGFVMMKAEDRLTGELAGYFFLRGFFIGRAFHGLLAAPKYTGHGMGAEMWNLSAQICDKAHLQMFATVSQDNYPSLNSVLKVLNVNVIKELSNNYLLIRCAIKAQSDDVFEHTDLLDFANQIN